MSAHPTRLLYHGARHCGAPHDGAQAPAIRAQPVVYQRLQYGRQWHVSRYL